MSRPITVAWFLPVRSRNWDRMPASCWIRCLQLLAYLERLGVRSVVNDPRPAADVAVFVRRQDPATRELALAARARGTRVVVDLCVNYLDETGVAPGGYGVTARHVAECRGMLEVADAVTAASAFIARRAREFHRHVEYLPDAVDRRHFRHTRTPGPRGPLTAIWCGYSVKAAELEPVLARLDKRGIGLVIVSDARPALSIPFTFVRWRHASAPQNLLRGDFAIAPRDLDFAYNYGHSFFRIGVFLAQGVPVVAGPVPSYAEVLTSEVDGLLCATDADWDAALDRIVAEPTCLSAWSAAAVTAMEPYWTETVSQRYAAFLRTVAATIP
jgi:hypothetical protein